MSNMKNGLSTLNRWWGKKTKENVAPSGKLSKSNTNLSLSVSTTNINETSQLEYNRITPLPVVTSNAPFEQTFRITVLLPKDQLYVARLGARVPLSKLLELVCENKLLDADKYEFRNPVDPSQVYSCDLSIGAVGLSEVRLCHKSESYDTFNADEVIKLHRTPVIRDSLSSSEFSSRYSKHTAKTTSPYSSSNSLNSMDSTGMNYTRTPVSPPPALPTTPQPRMAPPAPPRKKRAAPRPPSQTAIPERSALTVNGTTDKSEQPALSNGNDSPKRIEAMSRKDYCMSTPNLSTDAATNGIDCNGNATLNESYNDHKAVAPLNESYNDHKVAAANEQDDNQQVARSQVEQKNARNLCGGGSVQNLSSPSAESTHDFPEPSPRKRIMQMKKKSAPAPPPRGSMYLEDNVSLRSVTPSTAGTPCSASNSDAEDAPTTPTHIKSTPRIESAEASPKPTARETTTASAGKPLQSSTPMLDAHTQNSEPTAPPATPAEPITNAPKPVPRITTSTTLLNAAADTNLNAPANHVENSNVSKVMLNRTPTPEPRSLSAEPPLSDSGLGAHINDLHNGTALPEDDAISKQADSGIGEPVPSPLPDSLPSEGSAHECKSTFESSSDDDDMVKIYNFKLGKTLVKPLPEPKTLEQLAALADAQTDSGDSDTPATVTHEATPNLSDTASWNFAIPISPPPNFADAKFMEHLEAEKAPDTPITPKIKERPVLNFDSLTTETATATPDVVDRSLPSKEQRADEQNFEAEKAVKWVARPKTPTTPLPSPATPLNEIVDELTAIINDNRIDTLIRKADEQPRIESAKPNTLSNFSIAAIAQHPTKLTERSHSEESSVTTAADEDKLYRKRDNTNGSAPLKPRQGAIRADSFHTTVTQPAKTECAPASENGLNSRSSSHLSLTKLEQNGLNLSCRRSSSELSIGESPTLQSPEVIKTILNSRKNSLENSSGDGEAPKPAHEQTNRFQEQRASHADTKLASVQLKPKSRESVEKSEPAGPHNKPKELLKVYRYSGPPNINFSTWSERPKAQVSIKNEGDYIFGGKNADSQSAAVTTAAMEMTRSYRVSTPAGALKLDVPAEEVSAAASASARNSPAVAPKPASPTKRMGIPEQEFRVPVTVKPLRDVAVESVALRNATSVAPAKPSKTSGVATVMLNGAPTAAEPVTKRVYAAHSNTSTLPRTGAHRFSMPAQVSVGPALLRSTSITQLEAKQTKAPSEQTPAAPFGQNTLRRTGFKEKMLAREAEEQQSAKAAAPQISKQYHTTTKTITNGNGCVSISSNTTPTPMPTKTLQSAKLELKLQRSNGGFPNQSSSAASTKPAVNAVTPPPPPPPPMTASLKSVSPRTPNGSAATTPTSVDPRDQMLDAIRNFKRDTLKRGCV